MTTEDEYLRSVERMLNGIAPEHRAAVIDDLRAHFADADEAGRPVEDTIRGLGSPIEIAERAAEEFAADAAAVDVRAERAWRMLQGAAVVLAVVIGVVAAFIMPSYTTGDGTSTLVAVNGLWVALIALVPALVALVPFVVPRRARVITSVVAGVLLTAMVLIGGFTLGGFFLPTVLLAWTALIVWTRMRRGSVFGLGWRIAGGVLTALPVLAFLAPVFGGMPGRYADGGSAFELSAWAWPFFAALLALAVLMTIGYRAAGWAVTAIGAIVLLVGLVSGQLLTLLFVWLGGWWLTIGLAHAVTASRRP
ncbi:hypothetical protein ACFWHT_10170 [Microbacterium sp. NPDC058342]|uniref:HAAS signaling domain-containing protein n=1 Tax=Microbacterium sp. NPDC058342 TaxID=3346454 RepID=UPI00365CA175